MNEEEFFNRMINQISKVFDGRIATKMKNIYLKKEKQLNKQKEIIDKIKEYIENLLKEEFEITDPDNINYGEKCQRAYFSDSELGKILELLEKIE